MKSLFNRFKRPRLSIIVIVYDMVSQAKNTLYSLSADYQDQVDADAYEVIVVENRSKNVMGKAAALQYGKNYRYFLREETSKSPANAICYGVKQARGEYIAIMIDGARMLTPGVVRYILAAHRLSKNAFVAVPGYHLGHELQQEAVKSGYNETVESGLIRRINWPENGYRLFEIACFSGTCSNGFFNPIAESNCFSVRKSLYEATGGCDVRFDLPGGGLINLDVYKRFCEMPEVTLILLPGEGTFHQYHGGVSTGMAHDELHKKLLPAFHQQYRDIRSKSFMASMKKAVYLGEISDYAQPFIAFSSEKALSRIEVNKQNRVQS